MLALDTLTPKTYLVFKDAHTAPSRAENCRLQLGAKVDAAAAVDEPVRRRYRDRYRGLFGREVSTNIGECFTCLRIVACARTAPFARVAQMFACQLHNILRLRSDGSVRRNREDDETCVSPRVPSHVSRYSAQWHPPAHSTAEKVCFPTPESGGRKLAGRKKRTSEMASCPFPAISLLSHTARTENPALFSTRSKTTRNVPFCCCTESRNREMEYLGNFILIKTRTLSNNISTLFVEYRF